jgi:phage tail-like protein
MALGAIGGGASALGAGGIASLAANFLLPGLEDPYATARFQVIIERLTFAVFTECTLPTLTMTPQKIDEGGQNNYSHKLPTRYDVGTLKLKYGLCRTSDMLLWYMQTMKGDIVNSIANMIVMMHDPKGFPLVVWTFKDCYPIRWVGPSLKSGESAVAIEEIEFAYTSFGVNGFQAE